MMYANISISCGPAPGKMIQYLTSRTENVLGITKAIGASMPGTGEHKAVVCRFFVELVVTLAYFVVQS
ncbi:MAG: hypothetical protein D6730_02770 [Bacteroidetes bacterium]|nr:MAG: hypothetical protein D6730_02770 [Bacteroidota bacterium]